MFEKLKKRWELKSSWQVVLVLIVFACTGFTVMLLKEPIVSLFVTEEEENWIFSLTYYLLILPLYLIILLAYGFIFGQAKFFIGFVKRTLNHFKKEP
jgi:Na+-driven multidrug efflux pump